MHEAVIVDVVRTPAGKRNGKLKDWHPVDLGAHVLKALQERNDLDPAMVDDVVTGCVSQVGEQAFNIGRTEENYRIRDVAEMVAGVVPDCRVEFAEGASPDLRNYRVDFEKIRAALPAYKPTWTVAKGIEQLHGAYKAHGLTRDEFLSSRYVRIGTIKGHLAAERLDGDLRWTSA